MDVEGVLKRGVKRDAVDPPHYKDGWSDGAELVSITENLTSNGGQAVQYIARSTRLDKSKNKGSTNRELIEDLEKARWFIDREIRRLKASEPVPVKAVPYGAVQSNEVFYGGWQ